MDDLTINTDQLMQIIGSKEVELILYKARMNELMIKNNELVEKIKKLEGEKASSEEK